MSWFEIYYADGSVFSSEKDEGPPPSMGVQIVVQPDEEYDVIFETGGDFYYWQDNRWWGCDWAGIYQLLIDDWKVLRPTTTAIHEVLVDGEWLTVDVIGLIKYMVDTGEILLGRTVSTTKYWEVFQIAKRNKLTFHPDERKPE